MDSLSVFPPGAELDWLSGVQADRELAKIAPPFLAAPVQEAVTELEAVIRSEFSVHLDLPEEIAEELLHRIPAEPGEVRRMSLLGVVAILAVTYQHGLQDVLRVALLTPAPL